MATTIPPAMANRAPTPSSHADILRAASYTNIVRAKERHYTPSPLQAAVRPSGAHSPISEDDLDETAATSPDSSGCNTPDLVMANSSSRSGHDRDLAAELERSPKIARHATAGNVSIDSRSSFESRVTDRHSLDSAGGASASTAATTPVDHTPRASVASSLSRRAHGRSGRAGASTASLSSSEHSSSPERRPAVTRFAELARPEAAKLPPAAAPEAATPRRQRLQRRLSLKTSKDPSKAAAEVEGQPVSRRTSLLRRRSRSRPAALKITPDAEDVSSGSRTYVPSMPAVPKSYSTDRLPLKSPHANAPDVPSPRLIPDRTQVGPKKKDPLWSAFRELDGEHAKFASKTLAFKTNVVRTSLLPFLRDHAKHPSNWNLRPEDLDRRTNVLNKWWTGLIELLHGRNNQSIAGTDRFAILDAVSGIMDRPEWRPASSPFSPLSQRPDTAVSATSMSSTTSSIEFLTESVQQNVRNIFVQNLTAQVVFAVDKMALRNAPASLVTFCGKACAYAFMFVPGMADVLVRLWDLPVDAIRRVLQERGVGKFDDVSDVADRVALKFPPALQQLGYSSLMKFMKKLRTPPPLPTGTAQVQWWGPWLERWSGRESDLFYAFAKHVHILTSDFLPTEILRREHIFAPGFALVQAQILVNLDATIHRRSSPGQLDPASMASPRFGDVLNDPDAVVVTMPLPPTNAVRLMAENRVIMLVREFLSERAAEHPAARELFAESFNDLLQAAARGTSIFDHAACYTLLDFVEEALQLLVRYERLHTAGPLIDGHFWSTVSRRMLDSQNTMTEIRLFAFWYTVWPTVVCEGGRKSELCLHFLLDPQIFESRFNHWCPMVRTYYMRLLCWRVARFDGDATVAGADPVDTAIFDTLLRRLHTNYAHHQRQREHAERQNLPLPAITPCTPAPGRRMLIVRTDGQVMRNGGALLSASFDAILTPSKLTDLSTSTGVTPMHTKRSSSLPLFADLVSDDYRPGSPRSVSDSSWSSSESSPRTGSRSVGGFLRNLIGGGGSSNSAVKTRAKSPVPHGAVQDLDTKPVMRAATDELHVPRERASMYAGAASLSASQGAPGAQNPSAAVAAVPSAHRAFSFKFALEFNAHHTPPPRAPATQSPGSPLLAHSGPLTRNPSPNASTSSHRLLPPRLPLPAQQLLMHARAEGLLPGGTPRPSVGDKPTPSLTDAESLRLESSTPPTSSSSSLWSSSAGAAARADANPTACSPEATTSLTPLSGSTRYAGRALAEWQAVLAECQSFFERRRAEGVRGGNKGVETPVLGVEVLRRGA